MLGNSFGKAEKGKVLSSNLGSPSGNPAHAASRCDHPGLGCRECVRHFGTRGPCLDHQSGLRNTGHPLHDRSYRLDIDQLGQHRLRRYVQSVRIRRRATSTTPGPMPRPTRRTAARAIRGSSAKTSATPPMSAPGPASNRPSPRVCLRTRRYTLTVEDGNRNGTNAGGFAGSLIELLAGSTVIASSTDTVGPNPGTFRDQVALPGQFQRRLSAWSARPCRSRS